MKFALKNNRIFLDSKNFYWKKMKFKRILFWLPETNDYEINEYFWFVKIRTIKFYHFDRRDDKLYYARQYFEYGENFRLGEI